MNIRRAKNTEIGEIVDLVSKCFAYTSGEKISRDFPHLYRQAESIHFWVACDEAAKVAKIKAHAAVYMSELKIDQQLLSVAGIGGVCTEESSRGRGYAKGLIQQCCDDIYKEGVALAFLWSSEVDFYRAEGFVEVGKQWSISLPYQEREKIKKIVDASLWENCQVTEGFSAIEEKKAAHGLLQKQVLGLKRRLEDSILLFSSDGVRAFVLKREQECLAYMLIGKGKDLIDHIHEWAGESSALLFLLAEVLQCYGRDLFLLTPHFSPQEAPWIYSLDDLGFPMSLSSMSLAKIIDRSKIDFFLQDRVSQVDCDLDQKEQAQQWLKTTLSKLSDVDVLEQFFGVDLEYTTDEKNEVLQRAFPIRVWWWGGESV